MPLYDYECRRCGPVENVWAGIDDAELKHECGAIMRRVISRFNVNPDYPAWLDENLCGQDGVPVLVKGRRHQKQLLKERGLEIK